MNPNTAPANYLGRLIQIYKNAPSLAIWRAFEAQAFHDLVFEPPTLDLACGTGQFGKVLLGSGISAGCDIDREAIAVAEQEKAYKDLKVADARFLPYSDGSFNSVLSNCALEHIPNVEKAIAEVARVLKPMGLFAFTVPSEYFNDTLSIPRLYKIFGLNSRAQKHIQWYNSLQQHYHIDPLPIWGKRLNSAGFKLIFHRYYMPKSASLLFSLWDVMTKWTLPLQSGRPSHVQQFLLNRFTNRLLLWILYYHFIGSYRSKSMDDNGSGLLVVARREKGTC